MLHLTTVVGQMLPQIISPRLISSSLGHLFGAAEWFVRGSGQAPVEELAASEASSTIRLHVPDEDDDPDLAQIRANRRGA
jgi:hypothetical protein